MSQHENRNIQLIIKILLTGILIAALIYFFHPATSQFSIVINGEPVADPLARLAVIPSILAVLFFTGILIILAFLGAGMMMFFGILSFILLSIFFIAPFSWPLLLIIFLMILLMSPCDNNNN